MAQSADAGSRGRVVVLACSAVASAMLAAWSCAHGTDRDEGGLIGTGGAPSTTGVGAGSTGTQMGVTTAVASSGVGGACDEMPCKLVNPQCGCLPGEKCTWQAGMRFCGTDGTVDPGDICSGTNCKAGALCLSVGTLSTCRSFCDVDADCAGFGGICVMHVQGYEEPDDPMFCSDNCDPPSGTGCTMTGKCSLGLDDTMTKFFTLCSSVGTGVQGDSCPGTSVADCAKNFGCFNTSGDPMNPVNQCLQYCNVMSPICPTATTCVSLNPPAVIGSIEYGVCL